MKIFVTGAAGFVASHLLPLLVENGYPVTALVRSTKEKKLTGKVDVVVGDLAKKDPWAKSLKGHQILIHLAAEISSKTQKDFVRNNVIATKNLIRAAKRSQVKKIILFSSAAVTSIRQDWYAQTKKEQEEIVQKSQMDYSILRPSMIYGPGDTKNIGWLIKIIKKMPLVPLPGGGKFGRQPIYVDDICNIVLKLVKNKYKQRIFEIHGYQYVSLSKMVKVIVKNLGDFKPILPVPLFFLILPFWLGEKIFTSPKFTSDQIRSLISGEMFHGDDWRRTFGIIPTKFEDGIKRMIKGK